MKQIILFDVGLDVLCMADSADLDLIRRFTWKTCGGYVSRKSHGRSLAFHREALGTSGMPRDVHIDHRDRNPLNNRRSNLRICTNSLNQANRGKLRADKSSRFRGVTWHKQQRKWQAAYKINGKFKYLGLYGSEEAAARAYDDAVRVAFGEFASPNFSVSLARGAA